MDRLPRRPGPPGHLRGHAGHLQLPSVETVHQKHDESEEAQIQWRQRTHEGDHHVEIHQFAVAHVGPSTGFCLERRCALSDHFFLYTNGNSITNDSDISSVLLLVYVIVQYSAAYTHN